MAIPTALLRRFYVGRSLKNSEDGFRFQLANHIAPTTILSLGPLEVDGELFAPDQILVTASRPRPASAISEKSPLFLDISRRLTISIPGHRLPSGPHQVLLHAITKEVGPVAIEFDDSIP